MSLRSACLTTATLLIALSGCGSRTSSTTVEVPPAGPPPPPVVTAPPDLACLPGDLTGCLVVRIGAIADDPALLALARKSPQSDRFLDAMESRAGVPLHKVERATLGFPKLGPGGGSLLTWAYREPVDQDKLARRLLPESQPTSHAGHTYRRTPDGQALAFLDDRSVAMGPEDLVRGCLNAGRNPPLTLAEPTTLVRDPYHVVVCLNPARLGSSAPRDGFWDADPFLKLYGAHSAGLALSLTRPVKGVAVARYPNQYSASGAADALNAAWDKLRRRQADLGKDLKNKPDTSPELITLFDAGGQLLDGERRATSEGSLLRLELDQNQADGQVAGQATLDWFARHWLRTHSPTP